VRRDESSADVVIIGAGAAGQAVWNVFTARHARENK
jgi:malic enzyme